MNNAILDDIADANNSYCKIVSYWKWSFDLLISEWLHERKLTDLS